ncbi:MAG TPA: hypothetical protein VFH03_07175 [Actinoplanes sp.]|nr:hypothetical protein [Actinoplanes sp.]
MAGSDPAGASAKEHFDAFKEFAEHHPEFAKDIIGRLLDQVRELAKRTKNVFLGMVVTAVAFELLNRKLLGEASAFGFKVAKLDFLRYFAPIVMSFLLFQIINIARDGLFIQNTTRALTRLAYPALSRSLILDMTVPVTGLLSSANASVELIGARAVRKRDIIDNFELVLFTLVMPLSFAVYSIVQLFRQGDSPFIAAIATLSVTVLVLAAAVWALKALVEEPDFKDVV